MSELSLEEKANNFVTMRHIERVRFYLNKVVVELLKRGELHDQSKLESPEVEIFNKYTNLLAGVTYGSPLYHEYLKEMKPALDHHYAHNQHHPEYWANGIDDMDLIDLIELICDWKAATERHNDGNILKSITYNKDRFKISPQLTKILENTAKTLFGVSND